MKQIAAVFGLIALLLACQANAGPLRDKLAERAAQRHEMSTVEDDGADDAHISSALPAGTEIKRDIAYGWNAAQRFDVYLPRVRNNAPILVMVHGGGWRRGDKASGGIVENKAARWLPQGVIFVSVNYRLLPAADPLEQANDVARALATVQAQAASWGGDASRIVLMGHSAGAHLVSLITADPAIVYAQGGKPWLGTISLDSAAMDVVDTMTTKHPRLYDKAFGSKRDYWESASPFHRLTGKPVSMLLVCSTRRNDACPQANKFMQKAVAAGGSTSVLPVDRSHKQINRDLGIPSDYTTSLESFLNRIGFQKK